MKILLKTILELMEEEFFFDTGGELIKLDENGHTE